MKCSNVTTDMVANIRSYVTRIQISPTRMNKWRIFALLCEQTVSETGEGGMCDMWYVWYDIDRWVYFSALKQISLGDNIHI